MFFFYVSLLNTGEKIHERHFTVFNVTKSAQRTVVEIQYHNMVIYCRSCFTEYRLFFTTVYFGCRIGRLFQCT
ncbi:MAG: type II toxin-antitoxin system HigB family toxin [Planctomycetaceae bacterium]|nr:type II toxin-antitoxin system HigB family toxin [Planctomycetaceae bacterium]